MLQVRGLTKKYDRTLAVRGASFEVGAGEIGVLLGPNGAGKSTTIKSIAGLLRHDGEIIIASHPNKSLEAKRLFGYVPETPALYDSLTVGEHLEFIARAYGLPEGWQARADALMARFDLDDKRGKLGKELSKGMQQKLSICCALLPQPRMVMFDEPMIGLDPKAIKELKSVFSELRDDGCAVLISTHIIDSIEEVWDRALIMNRGEIALSRTREEVESAGDSLEALFFEHTGDHDEDSANDEPTMIGEAGMPGRSAAPAGATRGKERRLS